MKRVISLILVLILALMITGCSSQKTEDEIKAEMKEEIKKELEEEKKAEVMAEMGTEKKEELNKQPEDKKKKKEVKIIPKIYTGNRHSILLKEDKTLWSWGSNDSGQLGNGKQTIYAEENVIDNNHDSYSPIKIIDDIICTSAGDTCTLAVDSNNILYGFGYAEYGELGELTGYVTSPAKLAEDVIYVDAGRGNTAIIRSDKSLWLTGIDYPATAKSEDWVITNSFYKVLENVKDVSVSNGSVMALTSNNELYMMGEPEMMGEKYDSDDPNAPYIGEMVKIMDNISFINNESQTPQVVNKDGELLTWGFNGYDDSFGTGTEDFFNAKPQKVMDNVKYATNKMLLTKDNSLHVWGEHSGGYDVISDKGYLGGGMSDVIIKFNSTPEKKLDNIVSIASGGTSYAIASDGNVWAYGINSYGLLGNDTCTVWDYKLIDDGEYEISDYFIKEDYEGREISKVFNLNNLK